jgi:hypothetical protein
LIASATAPAAYGDRVPLEDLPHVDEHSRVVPAPSEATWDAVLRVLRAAFGSAGSRRVARLLGCEPAHLSGWDRPMEGSTVPGFRIVAAEPPSLLVVAGRHRFSRYGIVFRLEPADGGTRVRAETRATFPGPHGRLYRLAVVGSGGHVVVTRRLLAQVARTAEANRT